MTVVMTVGPRVISQLRAGGKDRTTVANTKKPIEQLMTLTLPASDDETFNKLVALSTEAAEAGDLPFILNAHRHAATEETIGYWHCHCLFPSFGDILTLRIEETTPPQNEHIVLAVLRSLVVAYLTVTERISEDEARVLLDELRETTAREVATDPTLHETPRETPTPRSRFTHD